VIIGTTLDPLLLKKMENAMLKSSLTKVVNKKAILNESFPYDLSFGYVSGIKPIQ
jgi:hypothetical protein